MAERTIGIDLGTTNSVVAGCDDGGEPRVLPDEHDEKIHPSVVSFHPNGTVVVGAVAKQRRVIDPKNTVFSVKRLIGRPFSSPEVQAALDRMPFRLTEGPNEQPIIHTRGGQFAIPEISAIVLDHMRAIAKRAQRAETTRAVITVPANFNEGQRSATATAGAIAGLEVMRVLNEPTAAAIAYGHRRKLDQLIAVYDFGGGTFDVSLLSVTGRLFEVVATAGNTFLGGDDIDETLVDHMIELFLRQENVDLRSDDLAMQRLRSVAEQIKIQLSRRSRAIVKIDEIAYGPGGRGLDLNLEITREELVARCAHVVDQTFPVCDEALELAGVKRDAVTAVVLVGGTTKMPYVRQRATQYFGKQPRVDVNPDEAVALGAALQANIIAREIAGENTATTYPRVGTSDTKSEVTRLDPNVSDRVAGMLRKTETRAVSNSVIVDHDSMEEFGDELTDGSGIYVSVDPSDYENTRAGSEITQAQAPPAAEPLDEPTHTATDKGWDAGDAWGQDSSWETYPATTDDTGTHPVSTEPLAMHPATTSKSPEIKQPQTMHEFAKAVAVAPEPDPDDELTQTREAPRTPPTVGPSTKPLPAMTKAPRPPPLPPSSSRPGFDGRRTDQRPPPVARSKAPLPPPRPSALPLPDGPADRMPAPPAAPQALSAKPSARTLFDPNPASPPISPPSPASGPAASPSAPPSARTLFEAPAPFNPPGSGQGPAPFEAPPAAPAGLGLGGFQPPSPQAPPSPQTPPLPAVPPQAPLSAAPSQPFQPPIIRDVTSYTLGIGTVAGFCEALVGRNTQIPHQLSRSFSTSKDGQTTVRIKVFQGESRRLDENMRLGDLVLDNLPARPRGETTIDVTFELDASGMLNVHAIDTATGYQQQARIEIRGTQSQDEVAASQNRMQGLFQ